MKKYVFLLFTIISVITACQKYPWQSKDSTYDELKSFGINISDFKASHWFDINDPSVHLQGLFGTQDNHYIVYFLTYDHSSYQRSYVGKVDLGPVVEKPSREVPAPYGETKTIVFEDIIIPQGFRYEGTIYLAVYDLYSIPDGGNEFRYYYDNARVVIYNENNTSIFPITGDVDTSIDHHRGEYTGLFAPGYNGGCIFGGMCYSRSGDLLYPYPLPSYEYWDFSSQDAICDWYCLSDSEYLGIRLNNLGIEINNAVFHIDFSNSEPNSLRIIWDRDDYHYQYLYGGQERPQRISDLFGIDDYDYFNDRIDSVHHISDSNRVFEYQIDVTHHNGDHQSFIICFDANTQEVTCSYPS